MDSQIISLIQDYSKYFIINLHYKKDEMRTFLYFSNNKFYPEKSIIRESHGRFLNLITNDWVVIPTNSITGYTVEDIALEKYIDISLLTDEDIDNQKVEIFKKIEKLNNKISSLTESFKFLKSYMSEQQYNKRFDIEFDENIENKDEYISKLAYDKCTCAFFNYYFLGKKIGVPLELLLKSDLTEEELDLIKTKWKDYLVKFVVYFVSFLDNEIDSLQNEEATYKEDLKNLISEVEEEVRTIHFKDAKTLTEILKVWPTLIAPAPFFLEDIV